jgi:hypothetical protein
MKKIIMLIIVAYIALGCLPASPRYLPYSSTHMGKKMTKHQLHRKNKVNYKEQHCKYYRIAKRSK